MLRENRRGRKIQNKQSREDNEVLKEPTTWIRPEAAACRQKTPFFRQQGLDCTFCWAEAKHGEAGFSSR